VSCAATECGAAERRICKDRVGLVRGEERGGGVSGSDSVAFEEERRSQRGNGTFLQLTKKVATKKDF